MPSGRRGSPDVGDGDDRRSVEDGVAHHLAQRRAGEQLEADQRADRVAGQPEHGYATVAAASSPKANGLAGLIAICIQRMSAIRDSTALTTS